MDYLEFKEKILNEIDRLIPPKVVVRLKKNDIYGYSYKRHFFGEGAYGGMSMLVYGIACEMQRICKNKDEMKEVARDLEKCILRMACDMEDKGYIIKSITKGDIHE